MEVLTGTLGSCSQADVLLAVAIGAAFLSGLLLVKSLAPIVRRSCSMVRGSPSGGMPRWMLLCLAKGPGPLLPVSRMLLRSKGFEGSVRELSDFLRQREMPCEKEALASSVLACLLVLMLLAWAATGSVACAIAVVAAVAAGAWCFAGSRRIRRMERMQDDVPEALKSLSDCVQAGLSLQQGFRRVAEDVQGPVGDLFMRAARRLESGCSTSQALEVFREGGGSGELAFVSVVLEVQHLAGGSVGALIDSARESVQDRIALGRELRVKTAQARLSAQVVGAMPFLLMAMLSLVSEGFLDPFFQSPAGWALFALALSMQLIGVMAVRRMLNVKGVG